MQPIYVTTQRGTDDATPQPMGVFSSLELAQAAMQADFSMVVGYEPDAEWTESTCLATNTPCWTYTNPAWDLTLQVWECQMDANTLPFVYEAVTE